MFTIDKLEKSEKYTFRQTKNIKCAIPREPQLTFGIYSSSILYINTLYLFL